MLENDCENFTPSLLECISWLEMGWWSPEEAWFALLGLPPANAAEFMLRERIMHMPKAKKLKDLIDRAVIDYQIKDLQHEGCTFSGYYRAPCKYWILWAKTKKSISIDHSLLQAIEEEIKVQMPQEENAKTFNERNFHSEIIKHAEKPYSEGNFPSAVFECAKAFEKAVQNKSKIEAIGESLMSKAFSLTKGHLKLNAHASETERNEQEGIMHLAIGFMKAIKNPQSHEPVVDWPISKNDALDLLSFLSFLWRQLDECQHEPRSEILKTAAILPLSP
jgi:uncharacterized protein (TIGR02391 family)